MACACKKNLTQQQQAAVAHLGPQYDFSINTNPLQTCAYCAMKHISLAAALRDPKIQAGQLMLASYHYNQSNPQMQNMCLDAAERILTEEVDLLSILQRAMEMKTTGKNTKTVDFTGEYNPKKALLHLCAAYCMLFTEIFYENINRGYAVGQLVLAALYLQQKNRQLARHIREIWKVAQQIRQPNDQHYEYVKKVLRQTMDNMTLDYDESNS